MADDIRTLSAALARDPSSLVYVQLCDALRRKGHVQEALTVALHGLGRHPDHADGYDALARVHTDRGELPEARAAWERALAIAPEHTGALKGLGFLFWRQGEVRKAVDTLEHARAAAPADDQIRRALAMVKGEPLEAGTPPPPVPPPPPLPPAPPMPAEAAAAAPPEAPAPEPVVALTPELVPQLRVTAARTAAPMEAPPRAGQPAPSPAAPPAPAGPPTPPAEGRPPVFAGFEGANADILLLDARGLVLAGGLRARDGADVSELAAAALAGVSGEAERTADYVRLGAWGAIVAEAEHANLVLAPLEGGAMLMVRRDRATPVGMAIRITERARDAARRWLEGQTL